jgi:hypothetical protein
VIAHSKFIERAYYPGFNKWFDLYPELDESFVKANKTDHLDRVQEEIIQADDAELAFYFAYFVPYKRYRMQKVILDAKNASYALLFAQNIQDADIRRLQLLVEKDGNIKLMTKFVCDVEGAKKGQIENLILTEKSAKCAYWLLCRFGKISHKLRNLILTSKCPRFLYQLAKSPLTTKKERIIIEDLIIASKNGTYIRLFARDIEEANLAKLEKAILAGQDMEQIRKFAKAIKGSKLRKMQLLF